MKQVADNDEFLIRYLLGELSEEDQEAVEERYIGDREFYEKLLAAEDDLIDAFTRGELSESRRKSFENRFLRIPGRRQRVVFASDWAAYVSRRTEAPPIEPNPASKRPLLSFLRLNRPMTLRFAAVFLVMFAGAWLVTETVRLRNRLEQAESQRAALAMRQPEIDQRAEDEHRRNEELRAQLEQELIERAQPKGTEVPTEGGASNIVSAVLIPGMVRGTGGAKPIVIPPSARYLRLQANFKRGEYQSYRAQIQTVEGRQVWNQTGLSAHTIPRGKAIVVRVPSGVFDSSSYILTLIGVFETGLFENVEEYAFTTVKK